MALYRRLESRASPDGFLPFDQFVDVVLYDPEFGYYTREGREFGPRGDYYTAPQVTPLFGATVARWVDAEWKREGRPEGFRIVELGPGDGTLAGTVIEALARSGSDGGPTEYVLVDRSRRLLDRARQALESGAASKRLRFRLADSFGAVGVSQGVVLAHELLDAQPFRRLSWTGTEWSELGVVLADGRVGWALRARTLPVGEPELPPGEAPGQVVEVSLAAEALVREVADHLVEGRALVIDFGAEESELRRRGGLGAMDAIHAHRWTHSPFEQLGSVDLSSFVNFSRIRHVASTAGLVEMTYATQAEWLGRWGLDELLREAIAGAGSSEEEVRLRLAVKNLAFGFSGFRVLEWAPGGASPTRPR